MRSRINPFASPLTMTSSFPSSLIIFSTERTPSRVVSRAPTTAISVWLTIPNLPGKKGVQEDCKSVAIPQGIQDQKWIEMGTVQTPCVNGLHLAAGICLQNE